MNPTIRATTRVPFLDLGAQYESLRPEIDVALQGVLESGRFVLGPTVDRFERAFADYVGTAHAVCVNSGTAALQLALMTLDMEPGAEVILPANTFMATAEAVLWAGGKPVLADVREDDSNIDAEDVERRITPRTRAIIPVHLYGRPARIDEILDVARRHALSVVEDACQAHGAEYRGRKTGSLGDVAAFSFYPGKNLGAYGEGGAVVVNDPRMAARVRMLRDHGQAEKYSHAVLGHNFRLDALQGAVLGVKLPRLDGWNAARRRIAGWYREELAGLPMRLACDEDEPGHVYHLFVVRVDRRDEFRAFLAERGVETLIHYPIPLHRQEALSRDCAGGEFPVAERLSRDIVSLPIYPEMTREHVGYVGETARAFFSATGAGRGAR